VPRVRTWLAPRAHGAGDWPARIEDWARLAAMGLAALFLALAALLAATIPFHDGDALAYGEWSRLIGETGGLRFPSITDQTYHRPLLYVLQGWTWHLFGFAEWSGRLLSFVFLVLLVLGVVAVARATGPKIGVATAVLLTIPLVPDIPRFAISGLTDVPVAATLAATGAALWLRPLGRFAPAVVGVCALLAALTKPTAFLALAALVAAHLIGERSSVRRRMLEVVPLAAGAAVALAYDVVQAGYIGESLFRFLNAGVTEGYYANLAADARADQLLGLQWLGPALRPVLAFALVYAVLRAAGLRHERAARFGLPAALALAVVGPAVATPGTVSEPFESTQRSLVFLVLGGTCAGAAWIPEALAPTRIQCSRLLVWAVPPLVAWLWYGSYETRLLSTAWPPLLALVALAVAMGVRGLSRVAAALGAIPVAVLVLLVGHAFENLDGLGRDGWNGYQRLGSRIFDQDATRALVAGNFARTLALAREQLGERGRIFSADGRFRFYFPARATQYYPSSCADLRGYRVFVLLTSDEAQAYMESTFGVSAEPEHWAACTNPRLTQLTDGSDGMALFRVES
jgi:4-amino-4-deoxy-L-arabinose transferase-like glycosyltransferase